MSGAAARTGDLREKENKNTYKKNGGHIIKNI